MFFLLRCVFWLGLVFVNIDWTSREPLLPSTDQVAQEAATHCLANQEMCSRLVAGAQTLYTASVGAAAAPHRSAAKPSVDTLSARDRLPDWHGPRF